MRAIKFRGLPVKGEKKEWVYGNLVKLGTGYAIIKNDELVPDLPEEIGIALAYGETEFDIVDPNSIGQFTGLYDKNGKEIYEGDIVRWYDIDYDEYQFDVPEFIVELTGTVEYRNGSYEAIWTNPKAMSRCHHDTDLEDIGLSMENDDYFIVEDCFNLTEEDKKSDKFYGIKIIGTKFDDILNSPQKKIT